MWDAAGGWAAIGGEFLKLHFPSLLVLKQALLAFGSRLTGAHDKVAMKQGMVGCFMKWILNDYKSPFPYYPFPRSGCG